MSRNHWDISISKEYNVVSINRKFLQEPGNEVHREHTIAFFKNKSNEYQVNYHPNYYAPFHDASEFFEEPLVLLYNEVPILFKFNYLKDHVDCFGKENILEMIKEVFDLFKNEISDALNLQKDS